MRLWARVYVVVLPLALLVLAVCSVRMLWVSYDNTMSREYARALGDHAMLTGALGAHLDSVGQAFEQDLSLQEQALLAATRNYGRHYMSSDVALSIYAADGRLMFSSMSEEEQGVMSLSPQTSGGRQYVVRRLDGQALLFVSGYLLRGDVAYRMDYVRNISQVSSDARGFAWQVAWWILGAAAVLGVFLYFLIHSAMRPLEALSCRARDIAQGEYGSRIRVEETGQGEVQELAKAFNDMAAAVEERVQALERAAQDRDTFMANLAHEMKTPMTTILGYADLLGRANLTEDQRIRALSAIISEGKRLDALSLKLLNLFRIRSGGEGAVVRERVDVRRLIQRTAEAMDFQMSSRGLKLITRCTLDQCDLDEQLFQMALMNLVENAAKASEAGTVIELEARPMGAGGAVFAVRDHGVGIAEDELSRIRQPFYMVDKQRARSQNGAGLGLTLCESIAKAHDAWLEIDSREGQGTEVRIRF